MKTLFKKLLIIGITTLFLEMVILYFLYTSINAFYSDLTNKLAFLLVEQVRNVVVADNLKISELSPYNKYPTRRLMNRFSGENSKILHILIIDTTNKIVVSDDPTVEGKSYRNPEDLELFTSHNPKIISKKWEQNQEILDVIVPIFQDSVKQGYLRTEISVKHLENFYKNRRLIFVIASGISLGIIFLAVFLTSRIYITNIQNIEKAIESLHESDYNYRLKYRDRDEFARLYGLLNQLFHETSKLKEGFHRSEERIDAIKRVIHEGMLITDTERNIISYNDHLLSLLKVKKYKNPRDQINIILKKNPQLLVILRKAMDPLTHAVKRRLHLLLLDDSTIDVQINASSIMEGETIKNIVFYIKNLSTMKELEENLDRSIKYTVIHQLARSFGHEIRNPLSSLSIHTEVLKQITDEIPSKKEQQSKIRKSLKILSTEIDRIAKLLDGFIDLISPKEIKFSEKDINDVISEIVELVQQEAQEKNIELKVHLAEKLPKVRISQDQVKQVILNLLLNAFDAMPDGGNVLMKTLTSLDNISIIIRDNGIGIPEEHKDKIFEFNFSTKPNGRGLGLGWSRETIERHGGKISYESQVGKGTTFIIELPST